MPMTKSKPWLTMAFDRQIQKMREDGILSHLERKWEPRDPRMFQRDPEAKAFGANEVAIPAALLAVGIAVGLFVSLIQVWFQC